MQSMKKNVNNSSSSSSCSRSEMLKHKERHIVSWSQEEDNLLREQIRIHGTDNWSIIASQFKGKTTRQCRRRWFAYLNSDFKKGGWSPEEDMLLCEAHKIFGNRWTEIAKVFSGRTDNAVKNRFSTLCKKRAKREALQKENNPASFINLNHKRVLFHSDLNTDGISDTLAPQKKMRRNHISDVPENYHQNERSYKEPATTDQQLRAPFKVLVQNFHNAVDVQTQHSKNIKTLCNKDPKGASNKKLEETFLKKDDPKILALLQQAQLLSSLALELNTENTNRSLESAWKDFQDFFNQTKGSDMLMYKTLDIDVQLENCMGFVENLRSSNEGSQLSLSWRQPDLYHDSSGSFELSTGSTLLSETEGGKTRRNQNMLLYGANKDQAEILPASDELKVDSEAVPSLPSTDFSSPRRLTPLFRPLTVGLPSPNFSESERKFLLKTLGIEHSSPRPSANPSQTPSCKRALLQSL